MRPTAIRFRICPLTCRPQKVVMCTKYQGARKRVKCTKQWNVYVPGEIYPALWNYSGTTVVNFPSWKDLRRIIVRTLFHSEYRQNTLSSVAENLTSSQVWLSCVLQLDFADVLAKSVLVAHFWSKKPNIFRLLHLSGLDYSLLYPFGRTNTAGEPEGELQCSNPCWWLADRWSACVSLVHLFHVISVDQATTYQRQVQPWTQSSRRSAIARAHIMLHVDKCDKNAIDR